MLPSDFAEHVYHFGSSHEAHSIIQSGLIPGGNDVQKGRHAVFFAAVNLMFIDHYREREYDLTKPRIAVYTHNWKIHQNTMCWCNLRLAQSKGLQFCQTRSNTIILFNTLPSMCIEKVVIRNLHYGRQDTTSSDARTSFDHSDKHGGTYRETCPGETDFRIQGLPRSAVQEHDHILKEAVQKLIHQFETNRNKEALQRDLKGGEKRITNPLLVRFLKSPRYRESQINIGWTEDHCARLDEIAAEDHSNIASAAERARRENAWVLVLNSSGPNSPMNQREDFQEAIRSRERPKRESGPAHPRPHRWEQVRQRRDQPFAGHDEGSERVDPKTGWK